MVLDISRHVLLASPLQTTNLAASLAPTLGRGDVVLLQGDVGAGKTHFARALIQQRLKDVGTMEDVPSPTYTIVQTYDVGGCDIWHADLYRLSDASEIPELGLLDAFQDAICLIEWPDRLGEHYPKKALLLDFSMGPTPQERLLTVTANGGFSTAIVDIITKDEHV